MTKKLHRISLILSLIFTLALILQQGYAEKDGEGKFKNLNLFAMTNTLQKEGIIKFLEIAKNKNWHCPKIHSAWYVKNLKGKGKNLLKEQEKRNFGLQFAKNLTKLSLESRSIKDPKKLESIANSMFYAIKWLGTKQGYGNIFLQNRAQNIGAIAVAKLACDLSYPLEKVKSLAKEIDWSWNNPKNRRKILYEEFGEKYFKKNSKFKITESYFKGDTRKYNWYSDKSQKYIQAAIDKEWFALNREANDDTKRKKNKILSIVYGDDFKGFYSADIPEFSWDLRWHNRIRQGFGTHLVPKQLNSLLGYRKIMGFFPTKVRKETMERFGFHNEIAGAFYEAAEDKTSKIQKERGSFNVKDDASPYDSGAALIYERYVAGTLYPDGEMAWERYKKKQEQKRKSKQNNIK